MKITSFTRLLPKVIRQWTIVEESGLCGGYLQAGQGGPWMQLWWVATHAGAGFFGDPAASESATLLWIHNKFTGSPSLVWVERFPWSVVEGSIWADLSFVYHLLKPPQEKSHKTSTPVIPIRGSFVHLSGHLAVETFLFVTPCMEVFLLISEWARHTDTPPHKACSVENKKLL